MPPTGPKPETINKVRRILKMVESGNNVSDSCREIGMNPKAFHMYRLKFSNMGLEGMGLEIRKNT